MSVRVRYAPSPTGRQHIGGVRTALFNYFYAKSMGGSFVLRIEDTDQTRYTDEAVQDLYDTFDWLGIAWDEGPDKGGPHGPYIQTQRKELYNKYAALLVEKDKAYRCYCSPERLESLRESMEGGKTAGGYDRHCRELTTAKENEYRDRGITPVIRYKVPLDGKTSYKDIIRGEVTTRNRDIPADPVILKSDGLPTYHFAVVIDDHLMKITHAFRAQEWLPNAPLHMLLYRAFGWEPPEFCHLPLILGKDGQKLAKRHGSAAVADFKSAGFTPEAIINYVSLLGWSYDDQREFFSKEELEQLFSIEKLNKAPAVFDYKKLEWFNGQYIRKKPDSELKGLLIPYLKRDGVVSDPITETENAIVDGMIPLIKERLRLLPEVTKLVRFLFEDVEIESIEMLVPKRLDAMQTLDALRSAHAILGDFISRSDEENEQLFRSASETLGIKLGDLLMPVRVAVTGTSASPPLFGSVKLLGAKKTMSRMDHAIKMLESAKSD
ncbi:MAG: glutamate--tRNA ligase [Spirochaetales bacterium]|nr:glutamate--tRNA ligase [Spirochaetales bacterium]